MKYLFACSTLLVVAACGGGDGSGGQADAPAADAPQAAPLGTASISGVADFMGSAPANPSIDMSEEMDCQAKHTGSPVDPRVVVTDGKLANVFIYVKAGLPDGAAFPSPAGAASIDQDGCLYSPRVVGVMVGQDLEIRNSDPLMHNIKAVPTENRGFNISQPNAGMTSTRSFKTAEIMVPLECNVHSWMHAYVGVLDHPYFAVTGADGSFNIQGLPAGTYEVEAWHEVFGTQTGSVTVTDAGTGAVDFTFQPAG
jgi:hypothetical protein